jgi:hypothetical protein
MNESTQEIPYGYCQCGCGQKAGIALKTRSNTGAVRGKPNRFLLGHSFIHLPPPPLSEYFWSIVVPGDPDKCWEWQGGKSKDGYGYLHLAGQTKLAHRVSYELHHGEIPKGLVICHKCDNPPCVNPKHLFIGTHLDNAVDRDKKGRGRGGKPIVR